MDERNASFQTGTTPVTAPQSSGTVPGVVTPDVVQPAPQASASTAANPETVPSPYESLDGPDETSVTGSTSVVSTPAPGNAANPLRQSPLPQKKSFGFRDHDTNKLLMRIVAGAVVIMVLIFGGGMLATRLSKNRAVDPVSQLEEQEISSLNGNGATLGVKTSSNTLLVNGNILATESLQVTNGSASGAIVFGGDASNRTYTLPDDSGVFCLDTNNCGYLQTDDVTTIAGINGAITLGNGLTLNGSELSSTITQGTITRIAGVDGEIALGDGLAINNSELSSTIIQTSVNNSVGAIVLQGTNDQVSVSQVGNTITFTSAQDIGTTSSPTFNSITLTTEGTQNGNLICDSSNNCGYAGGTDAFIQDGNSFGEAAFLGTNDNFDLTLETNGTARVVIDNDGSIDIGGHIAVGNSATVDDTTTIPTLDTTSFSTVLTVEESITAPTTNVVAGINAVLNINNASDFSGTILGSGSVVATDAGNANDINTILGGANSVYHYGSGAITADAKASTNTVLLGGSGSINSAWGTQNLLINSGSGSITNYNGVVAQAFNLGTGSIAGTVKLLSTGFSNGNGSLTSNVYGLHVGTNSGTNITNNYGILIQDQSGAGTNAHFNLYSAGSASFNRFEGRLQIADGDIISPSIQFTGAPGTGFLRDGSGDIIIGRTGTKVARFAQTQLVMNDPGSFLLPAYSFESSTDSGMYYDAGFFSPSSVRIGHDGTSSLAVGSTGIWSVLDGSAANPAWSFYSDRDMGLYRAADNQLGISVSGANVATISSTGLNVTGDVIASGRIELGPTGNTTSQCNSIVGNITCDAALDIVNTSTETSAGTFGINNQVTISPAAANTAANYASSNTLILSGTNNYTGTNVGLAGNASTNNSAGTITRLIGVDGSAGGLISAPTSVVISEAIGVKGAVTIGSVSGGGTLTNGYGMYVSGGIVSGVGTTITNNYGLYVSPQTAGGSDYGVAIGAADTQTLWLQGDGGTAASGIGFGTTRDTNLYRSAADTLRTDDALSVGGGLTVSGAVTLSGTHSISLNPNTATIAVTTNAGATAKLDVTGGGNGLAQLCLDEASGSSCDTGAMLQYNGATNTFGIHTGNGAISTERLSIARDTGAVGISSTLDVAGHAAFGSGASINDTSIISSGTNVQGVIIAEESYTDLNFSGYATGITNYLSLDPVGSATAAVIGQNNYVRISGGVTSDFNDTVTGSRIVVDNSGSGDVSGLLGSTIAVASTGTASGDIGTIVGQSLFASHSGSGNVQGMYGMSITVDNQSTLGIVDATAGLFIQTSAGVGATITDTYGIYVLEQTAGVNDHGIRIGTADTQTLWLDGDAGTPNTGIGFGSGLDTNLYRSGAGVLRTDDIFSVGTLGVADNASYLCLNGSSQLAACNVGGTGAAFVEGGNSFGGPATIGTNDNEPLYIETNDQAVAVFTTDGTLTLQSIIDSSTALVMFNENGIVPFRVDTVDDQVVLGDNGNATGKLLFNNASNSNTVLLTSATATGNRTITLPDASGTVLLNTTATGVQTANFAFQSAAADTAVGVFRGHASQSANLTEWQDGNGVVLGSVSADGDLEVVDATVNGNLVVDGAATFGGTITVNGHLITGNTSGSTSVAVDTTGAGTGASASISGNDTSGVITINTGTGAAAGTLATVTFANAFGATPKVIITPRALPGGGAYPQYHFDSTNTTFDLKAFNALTDGSTYTFTYFVTQ